MTFKNPCRKCLIQSCCTEKCKEKWANEKFYRKCLEFFVAPFYLLLPILVICSMFYFSDYATGILFLLFSWVIFGVISLKILLTLDKDLVDYEKNNNFLYFVSSKYISIFMHCVNS